CVCVCVCLMGTLKDCTHFFPQSTGTLYSLEILHTVWPQVCVIVCMCVYVCVCFCGLFKHTNYQIICLHCPPYLACVCVCVSIYSAKSLGCYSDTNLFRSDAFVYRTFEQQSLSPSNQELAYSYLTHHTPPISVCV